MENTKQSFFPKLMSFLFIAMGIFLGIYAFFANATTWTVGSISRDNSNYLSGSFRDNNPTTGDIVKALYGSGDDGSIYTQNWTGYTSGSCLSGGMNVEFTDGLTGGVLTANTIYVVASGTYDITSSIQMAECSALISSGTVIINGNVGGNNTIMALMRNNIIIENIEISGQDSQNGLRMQTVNNFSLHNIISHSNNSGGIYLGFVDYGTLDTIHTHDNTHGLFLYSSEHIYTESVLTYNNTLAGLSIESGSEFLTFTDIDSYNNTGYGIYINNGSGILLTNIELYENGYGGVITGSSGNTIHTMNTHNNDVNFQIDTSYNTTLTDAIFSTGVYFGLIITNSTGNMFSGITIYGNDNFGMHIIDSYYTTGINIISYDNNNRGLHIHNSLYNYFDTIETYNNNSGGILLGSSTYNTLQNINTHDNQEQGIGISLSDYTLLSGIIASGNTEEGFYITNSNYTTGINLEANTNEIGLNLIASEYGYFTNLSTTNNHTHGIALLNNSHKNEFDGIHSSENGDKGIYLLNTDNALFSNAEIVGNLLGGFEVLVGTNNYFQNFEIYNNTGGIHVNNTSGTVLDDMYVYDNLGNDSNIFMENTRYSFIQNSTLSNIGIQKTIVITGGYTNTISGNTLIGEYGSINIDYSFSNTITNNIGDEINMYNTTGNTIQLFGIGGYIYETHNSGLFQYTIYDTYTQANNIIILTSENNNVAILTGNTISVGITFTNHFNDVFIYNPLFENSIYIEGSTSFTISGDTWDGTIYTPTPVLGIKAAHATETGVVDVGGILETIEVVSGDTYLTMNEGIGTISYQVSGGTSGQYLKILKSIDGNTWTNNTTQSGCILDEDLICEFDFVDDFKLFAFGVPTNLSFTGYTFSGDVIESGHYYNTGAYINFTGIYISGATLNGTNYTSGDLIFTGDTYNFILTDSGNNSTGITFTIDTTAPSVTGTYPASGLNITGTNTIAFTRTGLDVHMSGYTLQITGTNIYTCITDQTGCTINMDNGNYTWYVIATDLAGNTGVSNSSTFMISTPLTGTAILSGGNMIKIGPVWYTNLDATFDVRANQPCIYTITGNYLSTFSGLYTSAFQLSRSLTGSDGDKTVYITFSTGAEIPVQITNTIKLDTVTYPATLISPLTGTTVASGSINLVWNGSSTVESVGYSGYRYYLSDTGTFATVLTSGFTATTGVSIIGTATTGVLYWKVDTIDKLGNTSGSSVGSFIYSDTADITPNSFSFSDIDDARRDRIYVSNTVYITGMTPGVNVLASINNGALYISGDMVGTTGFVQNGRPIKIELVSSNDYDETVSSTLTINGISDTFSITTMEEDEDTDTDYEDIETNLSNTEKLMIIAIFESIRDLYAGDKAEEFFNTFMVMLENKMDDYTSSDDEYDALKYLSDLIEQYYELGDFGDNVDTTPRIVNGIYTAPNGKKYRITYDSSKQRFTSTNFVVPKYFPTLDTLKYIIDINNPVGSQYANAKPILARWKTAAIDGTRQTSPYTAPNRKVFYFFKTIDGRYTSYTFTSERWFNSLNDVKEFIFNTNK